MPRPRRPTKLQTALAALLIAEPHISLRAAMLRVGHARTSADHHGADIMRQPGQLLALQEQLAKAGITDDKILSRLSEAMDYEKVQRLTVSGGRGEPSNVEEFRDIDNRGRLDAVALAAELRGWRRTGTDIKVQVQVNVLDQLGQELFPLVAECLDPAKRDRWAEGIAALARRYGAGAEQGAGGASAVLDVASTVDDGDRPVAGILASPTGAKAGKHGQNGGNGANGHGQG